MAGGGTLLGFLQDPERETEARFVGTRLPGDETFRLQGWIGDFTTVVPRSTAWFGEVPGTMLDDGWEMTSEPDGGLAVSYRGERSGVRLSLESEPEHNGERYRGILQPDSEEFEQFEFDTYTDPEPLTIVVFSMVAAACAIRWVRSGGRNGCEERFATLASQCIESGGTPRVAVHNILGFSFRGGLKIGCGINCDFICQQSPETLSTIARD